MSDRRQYMRAYYLEFFHVTLDPLLCPCGCGEMFTPKNVAQIYKDPRHKQRAWVRKRRMK
jgi:hypothetical protein